MPIRRRQWAERLLYRHQKMMQWNHRNLNRASYQCAVGPENNCDETYLTWYQAVSSRLLAAGHLLYRNWWRQRIDGMRHELPQYRNKSPPWNLSGENEYIWFRFELLWSISTECQITYWAIGESRKTNETAITVSIIIYAGTIVLLIKRYDNVKMIRNAAIISTWSDRARRHDMKWVDYKALAPIPTTDWVLEIGIVKRLRCQASPLRVSAASSRDNTARRLKKKALPYSADHLMLILNPSKEKRQMILSRFCFYERPWWIGKWRRISEPCSIAFHARLNRIMLTQPQHRHSTIIFITAKAPNGIKYLEASVIWELI